MQVGCTRFSRCCYLIIDLRHPSLRGKAGPGVSRSHLISAVELGCLDTLSLLPFFGSAQEFVATRMLGYFLKHDEFGLGDRHALGLEQQIAEIFVTAPPSKKGFDVAVDGFHHSEAYFGPAVV